MSSPKTSLAAIALLVTAVGMVLSAFASGDIGSVDWAAVVAMVVAAIGFFLSRDNNVSSEAVEKKGVALKR